jgi:hypothetical protein
MQPGNDWWLVATTPDGVHLYHFGHDDADAAGQRSEAIEVVRIALGFPGDEQIADSSTPWHLSFEPGEPGRLFDDGEPKPGVIVHDALPGHPRG